MVTKPGRVVTYHGGLPQLYNALITWSCKIIWQKIKRYLRRIHNLFITNELSLQLETLSNCGNFTVITILYDNDVLTWDYKDNNKYQVTMSESIKQFQGK